MRTEAEMADELAMHIQTAIDEGEFETDGRTSSYDSAGVLTSNAGFVLRMDDGSEYQVTVVKSR